MTNEITALDQPNQIEAYRLIATRSGLRMEIKMKTVYGFPPTACPTRGMALNSARRILAEAGFQGTEHWQRKKCLVKMEELCNQKGLRDDGEDQP